MEPLTERMLRQATPGLTGSRIDVARPDLLVTARQPYDPDRGRLDMHRPGRWDTKQNMIHMNPLGTGEFGADGSGGFVFFHPAAPATYLLGLHFAGVGTIMRLHGPWGTHAGCSAAPSRPGVVTAMWTGAAGGDLYFNFDCVIQDEFGGLAYLASVQAWLVR